MLTYKELYAEPVDIKDRTSAWLTSRRDVLRALRKVLGQSDYRARAGAYSGGANAVYWLQVLRQNADGTVQVRNITEGAKREIQAEVNTIEPDLLYPLLRGREVKKWVAQGELDVRFLVTHFPTERLKAIPVEVMRQRFPRTLKYLQRYEEMLRQRAAYKRYFKPTDPFYSVFNVGDYTFVPYKAVWLGFGASQMQAAVVGTVDGKPVVTNQAMHPFIPLDDADEAHYVCACLNSSPFDLAVQSHTEKGGKSFAQSNILEHLRVPRYDPKNQVHRRLAELSQQAHAIAAGETEGNLADVEREIDEWSAKVWGLTAAELAAVQNALREANA